MHFSHNVLQNRSLESVSVQSYKMAVKDMDIPYPSQHTMSGNRRPTSEMPFKCFRCCIAKKEERKKGGGGGNRLESPDETHSIFVVFFLHVLRFGGGGGGNC